jgi:predicted DNA-binding transcriptional regulator YafY
MLQTSARLLRLLSLFQAQRYWAGGDLSRRLAVTPRTLRRDVDRLRSLGYPVHSTSGTAGGYQLGAGAILPPLLLDDDEAVAVALGLRTAASGSVTGIEEASVRALLKLEQVLPPRLRNRVVALHGYILPISSRSLNNRDSNSRELSNRGSNDSDSPRPNRAPTVDAERLSAIAGACRDHEGIRFQYSDRAGAPSTRVVEPHRLVYTGYRWYLAAWDTGRKDWRTFRVDRIQGKLKTSTRFKPRKPPEGDFAIFVSKSLSQVPYPYKARITLRAPVEAITKRIPPSAGMLVPIDAESCMLHTGAHSLEGITIHLSMLGVDFQVHEPPELIAYIRRLAARLGEAIR